MHEKSYNVNVRRICFELYWKVQRIIAPTLKYSQSIYEDILRHYSLDSGYWLDLGCGHQLLPPWRLDQERALVQRAELFVGLDHQYDALKKHDTIRHKIHGNISQLPFKSKCFDIVTSNMVFEHLREPRAQLQEVSRVLKPGGLLIFHTPNVFGYGTLIARVIPKSIKARLCYMLDGRKEEDVFPTYYKINSTRSIKRVAQSLGFETRDIRLIVSSPQLVMIPPLAVLELLFIRILMTKMCRPIRTNIIGVLRKPN